MAYPFATNNLFCSLKFFINENCSGCPALEIDALEKRIVFDKPQLPDYIEKISISNLRLLDGICHFELYRNRYDVGFNVIQKPEDWEIIIKK